MSHGYGEPTPIRCTRVELWVCGWYWVKYTDCPEPVKKAQMTTRRCPNDAVHVAHNGGLRFDWCAEHAKDPTCGVTK